MIFLSLTAIHPPLISPAALTIPGGDAENFYFLYFISESFLVIYSFWLLPGGCFIMITKPNSSKAAGQAQSSLSKSAIAGLERSD